MVVPSFSPSTQTARATQRNSLLKNKTENQNGCCGHCLSFRALFIPESEVTLLQQVSLPCQEQLSPCSSPQHTPQSCTALISGSTSTWQTAWLCSCLLQKSLWSTLWGNMVRGVSLLFGMTEVKTWSWAFVSLHLWEPWGLSSVPYLEDYGLCDLGIQNT